jgi:RNA polymerase sigma-70 factor, ECF subfamily
MSLSRIRPATLSKSRLAGVTVGEDILAEEFSAHRAHLVGVAYRLTGTISDAEDAVQEAWLRLSTLDSNKRAAIRELRGWLTTVVGRICLDRLRSAAVRRESYVGPWLPEPVVTGLGMPPSEDPLETVVRDEGVRMAALVLLDRLTPEQRVAFVLHDAFGVPFAEIAETLGVSGAAGPPRTRHRRRGPRSRSNSS